MFSYPEPDMVLSGLGDKFLGALVQSVLDTRTDIEDMRSWRPSWFPRMHSRTLANLIHDRMWDHMVVSCEDDANVAVIDRGVLRELQVGLNLRARLKRHSEKDLIATYPTEAALLFYRQTGQLLIDGSQELTLAVGYRWDPETRTIGTAVVSYRDGKDNPIWSVELEEPQAGAAAITWKPITGPDLPSVFFGDSDEEAEDTGTGEPR